MEAVAVNCYAIVELFPRAPILKLFVYMILCLHAYSNFERFIFGWTKM